MPLFKYYFHPIYNLDNWELLSEVCVRIYFNVRFHVNFARENVLIVSQTVSNISGAMLQYVIFPPTHPSPHLYAQSRYMYIFVCNF